MIVLEYEDFTHTGLGLETYTDGVQHPLELRKILIGDLSQVTLHTTNFKFFTISSNAILSIHYGTL